MALEQGALTIVEKPDGSAHIVDQYGRITHRASGENSVNALKDAYGSRIGTVLNNATGESTVINEPKETPRIEVDENKLREVPTMHVEFQRDSEGNIVKGADGKNIVTSFGVKYADGTISYTSAGREGVLEAERRRSSAKEYNDFITDGRIREDFASDSEYQNFLTIKNIKIGQGSYVKIQDASGNSKLVAPNGAVVAEGTAEEITNAYRQKSNELNMAMSAAEKSQTFTSNEKQYVMQREGISTDEQFNSYVRSQMEQSGQALTNIYSSWDTAAQEQNVDVAGKSWYQPTLPDLTTFVPMITQSTLSYGDWYSTNIEGISAQDTISDTETGTETTQLTGETSQDAGISNVDTTDLTQQDLPQTVSYQMPQNNTDYTGSGFLQTGMGDQTNIAAPMTGTFTKGVNTGMMNYQPTQTYTIGNTQQQQQQATTSQYDVRMYRNNSGMTTSITFINGQPSTPIPSGFYPVGQEPKNKILYPEIPMPYVPQVATSPAPTVAPVTGYTPQFMNQGGAMMSPAPPVQSASVFGGFKPESMQRIANSLGYNKDMDGFDQYLNDNPDKKQKMDNYTMKAKQMAEGGMAKSFPDLTGDGKVTQADILKGRGIELAYGGEVLKASEGIDVTGAVDSGNATTVSLQQYDPRALSQQYIPQAQTYTGNIVDVQTELAKTPSLPSGATVVPVGTQLTAGQLVSPYSGQVSGASALPTSLAATNQAFLPTTQAATLMSPIEASGAISAVADQTQAARLSQISQIKAAQDAATSVSNLKAAQGTEILMNNPVQRQVQSGELISGVANAQTAATFNEEIQAATADPSKQATVAGQLEGLMQQFEGGNTPAWASGAMRAANASMIARGLGASSMAGQAIVQAAMESALPIAQMDAQVTAQFEQQNLSNRQQRAILAAQQRAQFMGQEFDQGFQARVTNAAKVSDIANMNFTAEQQVALENSRIANTMELSNLSNSQAMIMAEAAALANMDMSNLNNRQQAAVQNAQNFLQADLTNLNNKQSTELFKAQQRVQSLFTDQAALNAAQQFNATSQNQVDQFYASLTNNTSQFNASQANAQGQFNAGQVNVIERFNAEINNQRDQFNAQNRLVIDQANAQWRRQIATADTAAVNRSNEINAQSLLGYSQSAYNNLWQFYADNMEWAWTSAENERGRISAQAIAQLQAENALTIAAFKADAESSAGIGGFIGDLLTSDLSKTVTGSIIDQFFPTFL